MFSAGMNQFFNQLFCFNRDLFNSCTFLFYYITKLTLQKANEDSDDEKSDKKQKAEEELSRKTMESCDEQWKVASAQTLCEFVM